MKAKNIISITGIYDDDPMKSGLIGANIEFMSAPGFPPLSPDNLAGIAKSLIEAASNVIKAQAAQPTEIHPPGTGAA
jgi:hypothetical protein